MPEDKNEYQVNLEHERQETKTELEIREAATEQEVKEYFAFADPILKVDWGEEGPPEEYTPEHIVAHPDITQVFVVRGEKNEVVGGIKVKKLAADDKQRLDLEKGLLATKSGALLEYAAVEEKYRKQKFFSMLAQKGVHWAEEHDAQYVCAEVEITRPISAHTMMRDGFVIVGINEPGAGIVEPYFIAIKQISEKESVIEKDKQNKTRYEWKEIEVNEHSYEELKRLFSDGWVGVDIKNFRSSGTIPWTLILEKKSNK